MSIEIIIAIVTVIIAIVTLVFFLIFNMLSFAISIFGGAFWLVRKLQKNKEDLTTELQNNKAETTKEIHNLGDKIHTDYVQHSTCNERRSNCPCIKDIDNLKEQLK